MTRNLMAVPSRGTGDAAIPSSRSVGPVGAHSSLGVGRERENPEPLASPQKRAFTPESARAKIYGSATHTLDHSESADNAKPG
jgi:hypothetical protein